MRKSTIKQQELQFQIVNSALNSEIMKMSSTLDKLPGFEELCTEVLKEISTSENSKFGMSADQALKVGILRTRLKFNYRALSHSTKDSTTIRQFLKNIRQRFF